MEELEGEVQRLERVCEQTLAEKQRWQRFAEAAVEGVLLHDSQLVQDINPQFVELFGYQHGGGVAASRCSTSWLPARAQGCRRCSGRGWN